MVRAQLVTPVGVVEKSVQVPRISAGPDVNEMILGCEGTLGVVTEVTVKIRNLPEVEVHDSLVFPNFAAGVKCLSEIGTSRLQPVSIRLMDNEQFVFGHAMKPKVESVLTTLMDSIKTFYVTTIKG